MSTTNPDLQTAIVNLESGLRLLGSALDHLKSHLVAQMAPAWKLSDGGWVLLAPDRRRVRLAASERALLLALARHPARQMERQALIRAISGHAANQRDNGGTLSVLVSRLRKKAAQDMVDLPLRAVRGQGYALSVEIEIPATVREEDALLNGRTAGLTQVAQHAAAKLQRR
jgi:DNA-binding winged helix-turn-helix (wHTH) protein